MPVPTHDASCETRLWETRCPACAAAVYFFSCSCGSKVFFDLNHPPWNPHEDSCPGYLVAFLRDVEGYSAGVIWERVVEHANARGVSIPAGTRQQVFGPPLSGATRIRPLEIFPTGENEVRTEGQILNINHVNFFRRFNLLDNPVGRALLGVLANEPYLEITIRQDPDEQTGYSDQYTFFVKQVNIARLGLEQKSRATAILATRRIGDHKFWLAENIDRPW